MYSAFFHMAVLSLQAIYEGSLTPINYFKVLSLNYFFPGLEYGGRYHALSAVLAGLILWYLYVREKEKISE